jgi:hypothetical protein
MCGANNQSESDRHYLLNCHECVSKLIFACGIENPVERYAKLLGYLQKYDLVLDKSYERIMKSIEKWKK